MTASLTWLLLTGSVIFADVGTTERLDVEPTEIRLSGPARSAQVVVTGTSSGGKQIDLTQDPRLRYQSMDPLIARVDAGGRVESLARGQTRITVSYGDTTLSIPLLVEHTTSDDPVSFAKDIVPLFTRHGCNAGSCHGKASGQNGFKLSLLGFEPARDFESLVLESRGRRIFPTLPSESLLLKKPTAQLTHGGGKRFGSDSSESKLLTRWIAQGMRDDTDVASPPTRLEIEPSHRRLAPDSCQQLRVIAYDFEGLSRDITHAALFTSNTLDVASVDARGQVRATGSIGETSIVAQYRGQLTTALITVPKVGPTLDFRPPDQANLIDRRVFTKLRELGIPPSRECTDDEFARRSSLDICGRLPDSADVAAFRSSHASDKRSRWVDQLLALPEYADYFALKWGTILRNKRTLGALSQPGTFAFHSWIRQAIAENLPYHEFVERLLKAQGDAAQNPAVIWYRRYKTPEEVADDFGQLFLGLRLQCARCHHHPTDRWSTADYYGYASFFARIGRKPSADPTTPRLFVLSDGSSIDPSTGLAHQPRLLGTPESGPAIRDQDPRRELADWLGKPENPYLARAVVNRYWKHFFGRGLVEPEDDFRKSHPPSHPELLDDLAADFVHHNYDLKRLVRTITTSRTYDRSSLPEPSNRFDRRYFARYYSRQLSAEVLMDAIAKVTEHPDRFEGMPPGLGAVQLPDDGTSSEFLDTFGRPKRETVCECERASEPNLNQGLMLLGSANLQRKLTAPGGRVQRWLQDPKDDRLKVEELYEIALGRQPEPEELSKCLEHLHRRQGVGKRAEGYEDLLWTIINTKEFLFNH